MAQSSLLVSSINLQRYNCQFWPVEFGYKYQLLIRFLVLMCKSIMDKSRHFFSCILVLSILFTTCSKDQPEVNAPNTPDPPDVAVKCSRPIPEINSQLIDEVAEELSDDKYFGRWLYEDGILKAQEYLEEKFAELELQSLEDTYTSPAEVSSSISSNIHVELNGIVYSTNKLVINPYKHEDSFDLSTVSRLLVFKESLSFNEQFKELFDSLLSNSVLSKNVVVLLPQIHEAELRELSQFYHDQLVFRSGTYVSDGRWSLFCGSNNILFILTNESNVHSLSVSYVLDDLNLNNLVAVVPGKANCDKIVVFSAHYDHVGIYPNKQDSIANGANDNASGVAGVLALAEYYSRTKANDATLWFVLFNAEEWGLLGSQQFVEKYKHLKSKIVAAINLDMIGNPITEKGSAYLTGYDKSSMGISMNRAIFCDDFSLLSDADHITSLYNRSDNASFNAQGILSHTVTTFNSENYPPYHSATDSFDKIDTDVIDKIIRAVILGADPYVKCN